MVITLFFLLFSQKEYKNNNIFIIHLFFYFQLTKENCLSLSLSLSFCKVVAFFPRRKRNKKIIISSKQKIKVYISVKSQINISKITLEHTNTKQIERKREQKAKNYTLQFSSLVWKLKQSTSSSNFAAFCFSLFFHPSSFVYFASLGSKQKNK